MLFSCASCEKELHKLSLVKTPYTGDELRIFYESNDGSVAYFLVDNNGNLKRDGNYAAASLYKTVSKDEDDKTVEEYKDKLGQVVLKRSKDGGENVDTYFVNNDLGQLAYVIPPLAADGLTATGVIYDNNDLLKKYGYLYKYDTRGNCTIKRLPGCEPIFMVYDKADRLVLSQDGNQRAKTTKEWTVTKYDVFGRIIFTGVTNALSGSVHDNLITSYKYELIVETYTSGAYSTNKFADATPLTINFYDNYDFCNILPEPTKTKLNFTTLSPYDGQHTSAKGLLTGTRTYLLDGSGRYTVTAMYYDYRGQIVQTRSTNHLGGYDYTYNKYTFSGQVKQSLKVHNIPSRPPISELYVHDYDHAGRLIQTNYTLNNNPTPVILSDMDFTGGYDEPGRLRNKKRHNSTDAELFDYNIRNQPIRIKSGGFDQKLYYNTGLPSDVTPCYNGNIAYMTWKNSSPPATRAYKFSYDNLNRLTYANAFEGGSSPTTPCGYSEQFGYDKHGNINYLQRKSGTTLVDYFSFPEYNGNQLMSVFDYCGSQNQYSIKEYNNRNTSGYDFKYDSVGNMTKDLDRNIYTIRYNSLNLPDTIQFKDGHQIINLYDASGRKLSTRNYTILIRSEVPMVNSLQQGQVLDLNYNMDIIDETGTFYVDNIEYDYNGCDTGVYMLRNVYNTEGYATKFGVIGGPFYQYYRKDHLGNNREVWCANTNTTLQRTQYYPSGLPWRTTTGIGAGVQNRKYNDKEFVEMHGLDEYDSEARWYYPAIMRTTTMDPLAEKYYSISPYAWCGNNPIRNIDPDGRDWKMEKIVIEGVTTYLFTVNAALYNNSGTDIDMEKLAQGITAQIMSSFNFKGPGFKVSMDFNLKIANSINDISETDHVFQVVGQSSLRADENSRALGNAEINGLNIRIGTDVAYDIMSGNNQRTAAHELGHTGGLRHINNNTAGVGLNPQNLMIELDNATIDRGGSFMSSTELTRYQANQIYENRNNVNRNSPIAVLKGYYFGKWFKYTPVTTKVLRYGK